MFRIHFQGLLLSTTHCEELLLKAVDPLPLILLSIWLLSAFVSSSSSSNSSWFLSPLLRIIQDFYRKQLKSF